MWFIDVIGDKRKIDKKGVLLSSELWDFAPIYTRHQRRERRDVRHDVRAGREERPLAAPDEQGSGLGLGQGRSRRRRIANGSIKVVSTATEAAVKKYCKA